MVTAIFREDAEIFKKLAPEKEWKWFLNKDGHLMGDLTKTDDGYAAAGVMFYQIRHDPEEQENSLIYVRWVYASIITKDAKAVYTELFDELNNVATRLGIKMITVEIYPNKDYNYKELWEFLSDRDYILVRMRDEEILVAKLLVG